jgi:hypothetical protein
VRTDLRKRGVWLRADQAVVIARLAERGAEASISLTDKETRVLATLKARVGAAI